MESSTRQPKHHVYQSDLFRNLWCQLPKPADGTGDLPSYLGHLLSALPRAGVEEWGVRVGTRK